MSQDDPGPRGAEGPARGAAAGALLDRVRAEARALGFTLFGVVKPDPSDHMAFYREWLDEGRHGVMGYLSRDDSLARRADLRRTMEEVRSVVVVGHEYLPDDPSAGAPDPSLGVIARYARGRDYHKVVRGKLAALLRWLDATVEGGVRGRPYVDTGPILERDLARRAGLGWFGQNTMLIDPARGSYFFLGILLLDFDLPPSDPFEADRCGSCRACLDACPTGALMGRDERGAPIMDARLCISYLTIELQGPIPLELRPAIGNRVYGCDICQEACPWNERFAERATESDYAARGPGERPPGVERVAEADASSGVHPGTTGPSLIDLMSTALDESRWDEFSRGSAIRRAGRAGFARNVCVAIGNWLAEVDEPPAEAVAALREALRDEEPLVREHAAWALDRVAGSGHPGVPGEGR